MSNQFEKTLEEELMEIPYHEMKKEFEKRGIGECWTSGTKKIELVQTALKKLQDIKVATAKLKIDEGIEEPTTEEVQEELAKMKAKKVSKKQSEVDAIAEKIYRSLKHNYVKDGVFDKKRYNSRPESTGKGKNAKSKAAIKKAHAKLLAEHG
jgi:hypothetical protein